MDKIRLGILGTSEIAFRRFLPALKKCDSIEYVGVASRNIEKTEPFIEEYGGRGYNGYEELLCDENIDAVYIPLPSALHYQWAKKALEAGKHVFLEKPFTTRLEDTRSLIALAKEKNLALHENYMFQYHSQIQEIKDIVKSGKIGEIRLYKIAFGFPFRGNNDFRYNKELGGGALLDCGGYTVKLASLLLGESAKVDAFMLNKKDGFEVDIYGSATISNDIGEVAQISFGMDNSYKCELEIWGSEGTIYTNRILTAPEGFEPVATIKMAKSEEDIHLKSDDSFYKSILSFYVCLGCNESKNNAYLEIEKQALLVERIK